MIRLRYKTRIVLQANIGTFKFHLISFSEKLGVFRVKVFGKLFFFHKELTTCVGSVIS